MSKSCTDGRCGVDVTKKSDFGSSQAVIDRAAFWLLVERLLVE
jgi:hypothetical protein